MDGMCRCWATDEEGRGVTSGCLHCWAVLTTVARQQVRSIWGPTGFCRALRAWFWCFKQVALMYHIAGFGLSFSL